MTKTRKEEADYAKLAYKHAIEELLDRNLGGNIDQALDNHGCGGDIRNVVTLTDQDLGQLMHKEGAGQDKKAVHLNPGSRNLLRCLKAFYVCKKNIGVEIESTWCEISGEEFNNFRMSL